MSNYEKYMEILNRSTIDNSISQAGNTITNNPNANSILQQNHLIPNAQISHTLEPLDDQFNPQNKKQQPYINQQNDPGKIVRQQPQGKQEVVKHPYNTVGSNGMQGASGNNTTQAQTQQTMAMTLNPASDRKSGIIQKSQESLTGLHPATTQERLAQLENTVESLMSSLNQCNDTQSRLVQRVNCHDHDIGTLQGQYMDLLNKSRQQNPNQTNQDNTTATTPINISQSDPKTSLQDFLQLKVKLGEQESQIQTLMDKIDKLSLISQTKDTNNNLLTSFINTNRNSVQMEPCNPSEQFGNTRNIQTIKSQKYLSEVSKASNDMQSSTVRNTPPQDDLIEQKVAKIEDEIISKLEYFKRIFCTKQEAQISIDKLGEEIASDINSFEKQMKEVKDTLEEVKDIKNLPNMFALDAQSRQSRLEGFNSINERRNMHQQQSMQQQSMYSPLLDPEKSDQILQDLEILKTKYSDLKHYSKKQKSTMIQISRGLETMEQSMIHQNRLFEKIRNNQHKERLSRSGSKYRHLEYVNKRNFRKFKTRVNNNTDYLVKLLTQAFERDAFIMDNMFQTQIHPSGKGLNVKQVVHDELEVHIKKMNKGFQITEELFISDSEDNSMYVQQRSHCKRECRSASHSTGRKQKLSQSNDRSSKRKHSRVNSINNFSSNVQSSKRKSYHNERPKSHRNKYHSQNRKQSGDTQGGQIVGGQSTITSGNKQQINIANIMKPLSDSEYNSASDMKQKSSVLIQSSSAKNHHYNYQLQQNQDSKSISDLAIIDQVQSMTSNQKENNQLPPHSHVPRRKKKQYSRKSSRSLSRSKSYHKQTAQFQTNTNQSYLPSKRKNKMSSIASSNLKSQNQSFSHNEQDYSQIQQRPSQSKKNPQNNISKQNRKKSVSNYNTLNTNGSNNNKWKYKGDIKMWEDNTPMNRKDSQRRLKK